MKENHCKACNYCFENQDLLFIKSKRSYNPVFISEFSQFGYEVIGLGYSIVFKLLMVVVRPLVIQD